MYPSNIEGSWIGVYSVKFVFETEAKMKFEANWKVKFDTLRISSLFTTLVGHRYFTRKLTDIIGNKNNISNIYNIYISI